MPKRPPPSGAQNRELRHPVASALVREFIISFRGFRMGVVAVFRSSFKDHLSILNQKKTYYPIWRQYTRQKPHYYSAVTVQNGGWVIKVSKFRVLEEFLKAGILQGVVICGRPCIFYAISKTSDIPLSFICQEN